MVVQRVILAGLVATFGLTSFDTEAQARHCRRARCCNYAWNGGCQQVAFQQTAPINACAYQAPYGQAGGQMQPYQDGQLNAQGQFQNQGQLNAQGQFQNNQGQLNAQGQVQGRQQAPPPPQEPQNNPAPAPQP